MQDAQRVLKQSIAEACSNLRVSFGKFASSVGLNDFLMDAFDVPRNPREIAALALDQLSAKDKGLNDRVLCLAVVRFLDETYGAPSEDPEGYQRLKDLVDVLTSPGTYEAILRWAESWYS